MTKQEEKDLSGTAWKETEVSVETKDGKISSPDFDGEKNEISLEQMFKSGVHFGHHKSRKNPKAEEYIFGVKNGINIIDLQKTAEGLRSAMKFLEKIAASGEEVLFVGTKKQAKQLVKTFAEKCEMPYVNERWLGGTFTNFSVIAGRTKYLREGLEKLEKGEYSKYTKFEQMKIKEELERLERKMGGIKKMINLPGAVFCVSVIEDNLAIKEAKVKGIPIVALCDTNVSSEGIEFPIPANEDAVSSLRLMLEYISRAVAKGKNSKIKKAENLAEEVKNS